MNLNDMNSKIDFVIPWLDPTDPEWINCYNLNSNDKKFSSENPRFRDWDNLKYWFRGIEKFAPWVNKIHFITYGHTPQWLNKSHEKLIIVNHKDYIDNCYLPTFSSHTLELNMHKIENLADNFVYFNDDTFLINPISEEYYFEKNNMPKDSCIFNTIVDDGELSFYLLNNLKAIERNFNKHELLKEKPSLFFNRKYGKLQTKNLLLIPWKNFTGFQNFHLPQPFNKSTLFDVWEKEYAVLNNTCLNKFRSRFDVNQYLFRYWHLLSGRFSPSNIYSSGVCISPTEHKFKEISSIFSSSKVKVICINDNESVNNFETTKKFINSLLNKKLPNKSSFEI
ncbi:glycosyl transferase [Providencia rettgeri]